MPDVIDVLRNLPRAVTPGPASPEVVAADVTRGRHAVTRRRRLRLGLCGAAVAVAVAVAVGAGQVGRQPGGTAPSARVQFVSYTGQQPKGFKISTVPDGWQVISDDESSFVVAPPGQDVSPPKPGHAFGVGNRIAVSLQGLTQLDPDQHISRVDINGEEGQLGFARERGGKLSDIRWLIFPDGAGHRVLVQVPASVRLTDDQVVRFARGIGVTGEAREIGG